MIALSLDLTTVRQIANCQPGWHSANDVAWTVAGDSYEGRSDVKRCLSELHRSGEVERIFVLHNGNQMLVYDIDPQHLWRVLEGLEA